MNQKDIQIGTHGEQYESWMSKPVFYMFGGIAGVLAVINILSFAKWHSKPLEIISSVGLAGTFAALGWMAWVRKQYAFGGGGMMDKVHQVILGKLDFNGKGNVLEVGCGSGPLSVRCAKTWPNANVTGIDYWGAVWDYNKELCDRNATLEGVGNRCQFYHGNAKKLEYGDESFDALVSNYVYHNIVGADMQELLLESLRVLKKGGAFLIHDNMSRKIYGDMDAFVTKLKEMGYEKVELIDTTKEIFGSKQKAKMLMLGDSKLLYGIK